LTVFQFKVNGGVDPSKLPSMKTFTETTGACICTVIGTMPETASSSAGETMTTGAAAAITEVKRIKAAASAALSMRQSIFWLPAAATAAGSAAGRTSTATV